MQKKLLIVDCHDEFRRTLITFLEQQNLNLQILEANSEESGVQMSFTHQPHVVLLEHDLPKMNGIKTSKLIKNAAPECRIILASLFASELFRNKVLKQLIDDFIGKSEFDCKLVKILEKQLKGIKN